MLITEKTAQIKADEMRGRFGFPNEFGDITFGWSQFGDSNPYSGIYQIRHRKGRQVVARMRFAYPRTYTTGPAIASKNKFRDAMDAYDLLTTEQKAYFIERVKGTSLLPHNLFVKLYMLDQL